MITKTKKHNEFYNKVVRHLMRETDADYVNKTMMDIEGDYTYVGHIFYFPWKRNNHVGNICRMLEYDLYDEYKNKSFLPFDHLENFYYKWNDYIMYVRDTYGVDFEESFILWGLYTESMKEKYLIG